MIIDSEAQLRAGEDVIHTTRVAVRRLRSTIRVFSSCSTLPRQRIWRRSWSGGRPARRGAGYGHPGPAASRLLEEMPAELILGPVASTIQTELGCAAQAGNGRNARGAGLRALPKADRTDPSTGALTRRSPPPPTRHPTRSTPRSRRPGRRQQAAQRGGRRAARRPSDELFHRARKASKRHRYAVEAALPVWGDKADKIISQRKDLQDLLGNHQDSIVSAAFLRELGGRLGIRSGQNGFSYGVLYARELQAGDSLLDDLKPFL